MQGPEVEQSSGLPGTEKSMEFKHYEQKKRVVKMSLERQDKAQAYRHCGQH